LAGDHGDHNPASEKRGRNGAKPTTQPATGNGKRRGPSKSKTCENSDRDIGGLALITPFVGQVVHGTALHAGAGTFLNPQPKYPGAFKAGVLPRREGGRSTRQFQRRIQGPLAKGTPTRLQGQAVADYFDSTRRDQEKMILERNEESRRTFAEQNLRPPTPRPPDDGRGAIQPGLIANAPRAAEWASHRHHIPEDCDGHCPRTLGGYQRRSFAEALSPNGAHGFSAMPILGARRASFSVGAHPLGGQARRRTARQLFGRIVVSVSGRAGTWPQALEWPSAERRTAGLFDPDRG